MSITSSIGHRPVALRQVEQQRLHHRLGIAKVDDAAQVEFVDPVGGGFRQHMMDAVCKSHRHGARPCHHRSEEHTSELQSLMRTTYAVFCLQKNTTHSTTSRHHHTR